MRLEDELLINTYRQDSFFQKLKEVYDKWKNHQNKKKHIVDNEPDILLLRLKVNFTKYPNILLNLLTEIDFSCKDCFKAYVIMYKHTLRKKNNMSFSCKKEYIRRIIKVNRNTLDRILNELKEKNMILVEKEESYFKFTLNLSFLNWNVSEIEKEKINEIIEKEKEWYQERYIDEERIL